MSTFVLGFVAAGPAMGQHWFVEDFDTYGACGPAFPCDCVPDRALFLAPPYGTGTWGLADNPTRAGIATGSIASDWATCPSGFRGFDEPFSWDQKKGANRNVLSLISHIQTESGDPTKNAVNGTDATPLILDFHLYAKEGKQGDTSMWLELLAQGADPLTSDWEMRAPIYADTGGTCDPDTSLCVATSRLNGMPCESDIDCLDPMRLQYLEPLTNCTMLNDSASLPRPAMAFGYYGGHNGLAPKPPCELIGGNASDGLGHPVLYDGDAWWQLKGGVPTGSSGDEFDSAWGDNGVIITIRETTMDIELRQVKPSVITVTKTGIPRQYTGPFQAVAMGTGPIRDGAYTDGGAILYGPERPGYIDRVRLEGGVFVTVPTGACCLIDDLACIEGAIQEACEQLGGFYAGDGTDCGTANCPSPPGACCVPEPVPGGGFCVDDVDQETCVDTHGGVYQGGYTTCSDPGVLCCPDPFADMDGDQDVDQDDFAVFQGCMTSGLGTLEPACKCLDQVNNGEIDEDDWGAFEACASGPDVPADATCDDPI